MPKALDAGAELLREAAGPVLAGAGEDEHELLAPVARGQVSGPVRDGAHRLRHLDQALVSGQVAVAVVEVLEEVDVAEDQGQGRALAGGATPFLLQDLVEPPPIGEPGQGVEGGETLELGVAWVSCWRIWLSSRLARSTSAA